MSLDLRTGLPVWLINRKKITGHRKLAKDIRCEVAVVGGGVSGALIAHRLVNLGRQVIIVDRRDVEVSLDLVRRVVIEGYAPDLTDDQVEELGRDPFLIAYALAGIERCLVTTEVSKPAKTRQNRQLPDVCQTFGVAWCGPFKLNSALGFNTTGFKP